MEQINLLSNKMTASPAHHAVIELIEKTGLWFYGYRVILKTGFHCCPIPDEQAATTQRGEQRKEIALLFALYEITRTTWTGRNDMDESAIGAALLEEAQKMLNKTTQTVLMNHRQIVLNTPRLCARFYYMLPEYRELFHIENSFDFGEPPMQTKAAQRQLSLF